MLTYKKKTACCHPIAIKRVFRILWNSDHSEKGMRFTACYCVHPHPGSAVRCSKMLNQKMSHKS